MKQGYFNTKKAAEIIGVSRRRLNAMKNHGQIRSEYCNCGCGRDMFSEDEINRVIEWRKQRGIE